MDYGLILTWSVTLDSQNFACDAIFVYKETKFDEILMENMPVKNNENKKYMEKLNNYINV